MDTKTRLDRMDGRNRVYIPHGTPVALRTFAQTGDCTGGEPEGRSPLGVVVGDRDDGDELLVFVLYGDILLASVGTVVPIRLVMLDIDMAAAVELRDSLGAQIAA